MRFAHAPAALLQILALLVGASERERELERRRRVPRQIEKGKEAGTLVVRVAALLVIDPVVVHDPVGDGRERGARSAPGDRPRVQAHARRQMQPRQPAVRE